MARGGRVLHHLEQRLPDARNAVLLAGFQAEGSRGRALQDGAKSLRIHGRPVPVDAEIVSMGQLSAHAGKSELLRWLSGLPPAQAHLPHARRTTGCSGASVSNQRQISMESRRGAVPADSGVGLKIFGIILETFPRLTSSIPARPLVGAAAELPTGNREFVLCPRNTELRFSAVA